MGANSETNNLFRLLVPATDRTPLGTASVELCGSSWVLAEFEQISDAPPYVCVSYSWGDGTTSNPLEDGHWMSDRTIPAVETTIKVLRSTELLRDALTGLFRDESKLAEGVSAAHQASQAIWIDAFCVPYQQPARKRCIDGMGAIYRGAALVIAVLQATCGSVIHKIQNNKSLTLDDLLSVEGDNWATRAATYPEIVNSRVILFAAEGNDSFSMSRGDFLSGLLTCTTDYGDAQGWERTKLSVQFPKLDAMQELFAEEQIAGGGRSVFQVMSAMHQRSAKIEDHRIYSMLGVINEQSLADWNEQSTTLAEYFRSTCEQKEDYSFIYSVGPRSKLPGRKWRPDDDQITPVVFGILASGHGLSGRLEETHLQMNNMSRMKPGRINPVLSAIGAFLGKKFQAEILERLRHKGFTGCGECLVLEYGYFFSQQPLPRPRNDLFVAFSNDVIFTQGAPALLLRSNGTDVNEFCDLGVFLGRCPEMSESINVG